MTTFQYTVTDPNGLHARPAGLLVKSAAGFQSAVTIKRGDKSADLTRLFAVMGLAVKQGETVEVSCDGPDEAECAKTLEDFFKQNF